MTLEKRGLGDFERYFLLFLLEKEIRGKPFLQVNEKGLFYKRGVKSPRLPASSDNPPTISQFETRLSGFLNDKITSI